MPAKVLVVDDSALMRRLLSGVLSDAGFEVIVARNGAEGVQQLTDCEPDVVTLDINMPEMDGLTALSLMMQARPTPVVMVSSLTEKGAVATFEALALGAVDFIAKPGGTISLSVDDISQQLVAKVKAAARARMRGGPAARPVAQPAPSPRPAGSLATREAAAAQRLSAGARPKAGQIDGLVIVGVSTGGPRTLEDILPALPAQFPWPVLVAQHMPPNFTGAFANRMDGLCRLRVRECAATMPIEPGHIYIGAGGTDMVVVNRLGRLAVQPRPETPGHPWHPSVDVLVQSAMALLPAERIVGVQLTGMGDDGARAMADLKKQGGRTIAESKDTAVVFGMPQELIERGGASVVLPCGDVTRQLCHWIR
ncbi:chemotaxis-specific protein-glutamate methyltransferase CheB [Aquabacterium sp. OR-4]|uniref:chemotaxis-specific protein-glutamate methyltransferase CheB n=1 Tax=Aquabacterium sp. OR-4 TaxID=2978127 RepID=UPI0021B24FC6|nr:chemotaxis-specific protein-glutamate methyltransferase CheB [Aquabacterium sp. OR-4]MDT7835965.1 chemotaxis-specific protein-glutamate methyltransferase CheB [Aquabacterium sp. OR-4]